MSAYPSRSGNLLDLGLVPFLDCRHAMTLVALAPRGRTLYGDLSPVLLNNLVWSFPAGC